MNNRRLSYSTWITVKNGRVDRVRQHAGTASPGPQWRQVPNDWGGSQGDKIEWLDDGGRRVPDHKLIETGKRKDFRGPWHHKEKIGEVKFIQKLDEEPGEEYTKELPLPNEPFQKWDAKKQTFAVDTKRRAEADKEQKAAAKKSAIQDAERRMLRSIIARQRGKATAEDEKFFTGIGAEIDTLQAELQTLQDG